MESSSLWGTWTSIRALRSPSQSWLKQIFIIPASQSEARHLGFFLINSISSAICPQKVILQMKNHERQISSEIKLFKPSAVDLSPYRFQAVAKNFRKKPQNPDGQGNGSANFLKMEAYRKTETRSSPNRSESRTKTSRKRSLEKFLSNQRAPEKTTVNQPQNSHQSTLGTRSKLMRINGILGRRVTGSSKEMIIQVYERHDEYLSLVKQWKHLDIFDQIDKLVQSMLDSQMKIVQDILEQTLKSFKKQLAEYEQTLKNLQDQNNQLSSQLVVYSRFNEIVIPLKERLMQEYQKSQWSTFIMNSLALNSFDIESYIKSIPLYKKWVNPLILHEMEQKQHEAHGNDAETERQRWMEVFEKRASGGSGLEEELKRRESM